MTRIGLSAVVAIALIGFCLGQAKKPTPDNNAPVPCIVFGAVRNPARIQLRSKKRLAELLDIVGGVTKAASGVIQIIHTERDLNRDSAVPTDLYELNRVRAGDLKSNPYVEPGDIVIVQEAEPIYVMGRVKSPKAIYSKRPVRLSRAIAMAGGLKTGTDVTKIVIQRWTKGKGSSSIQIDFDKTLAADPILQRSDIVVVGNSPDFDFGLPVNFDTRPLVPLPYRIIF